MEKHIQQIPSDTTIEKIDISGDALKITCLLWTEEKAVIEFQYCALHLHPSWKSEELIEDLKVSDQSELLTETKRDIARDEIPIDNPMSFQFVFGDGEVGLEVIAGSVIINGETLSL